MLVAREVKEAATEFPGYFSLRSRVASGVCRINLPSSFVGSDGTIWLVVECYADRSDWPVSRPNGWLDVVRVTVDELRSQVIDPTDPELVEQLTIENADLSEAKRLCDEFGHSFVIVDPDGSIHDRTKFGKAVRWAYKDRQSAITQATIHNCMVYVHDLEEHLNPEDYEASLVDLDIADAQDADYEDDLDVEIARREEV